MKSRKYGGASTGPTTSERWHNGRKSAANVILYRVGKHFMLLVGQEAFTVTSTSADFYEIDRVEPL